MATYLGNQILIRPMLQQNCGSLLVALLGRDMKRSVQVLGCGVNSGAVLQKEEHVVNVAQSVGEDRRDGNYINCNLKCLKFQENNISVLQYFFLQQKCLGTVHIHAFWFKFPDIHKVFIPFVFQNIFWSSHFFP